MKRNRTLLAMLVPFSLFALGCGEDVGLCQDPEEGRDTVLVGTQVQYGGQAIINQACASCHGSESKGVTRRGAPAGLDFDLYPIEDGESGTNNQGDAIVKLTSDEISGLRERQRKVFEDRNLIWQQVKDGLMPPDGIGGAFRTIIKLITNSAEQTPCTKGKAYADITQQSSQAVLRNWLACGAPIVESNSGVVQKNGVAGVAGYQYPSCAPAIGGDGGTEITIELIQTNILDGKCVMCHSEEGGFAPDLSTAEKSYAVLVADTGEKCEGKPFVKSKDVAGSYFYDKVAKDDPGCGDRMPVGGMDLSMSELKLISDWITAGALRAADVKSKALGPLGVDAGVP